MSFNPAEFLKELDIDEFDGLSKEELLTLGKHLKLTVKRAMRKAEIQRSIVECFVDQGELEETVLSSYVSSSDLDVRKLELQAQLELSKLELEKEKLAQEDRERDREKSMELEKQRMEHEREMKKLEIESRSSGILFKSSPSPEKFDVAKNIRLVPPFQEKEVDGYFLHFEKIATSLKWPKEFWTMLLQSVLVGKLREIYTQLTVEQASDYDDVKELVLKGYELVPEAYRQKFRNCRRESNQSFVEFARTKEQLFDRWCTSRKVMKSFVELRQLILIEEFKRCIGSNVKTFLDEKGAVTLEAAARSADDYNLTHKTSFNNHPTQSAQVHEHKQFGPNVSHMSKSVFEPLNNDVSGLNLNPKSTSFTPRSLPRPFNTHICNYCKKEGHILPECLKLKRKQTQSGSGRPTGFFISTPQGDAEFKELVNVPHLPSIKPRPTSDSIMEMFQPFLYDGYVSLSSDESKGIPIRILRDTGASQSLIVSDILPFSESTYSGVNVLIQGVDSTTYSSVPLHHVHLTSALITGPVTVGLKSSLPFDGVHFILGNDLAGDKVKVNPLVVENPCYDQKLSYAEQEIPGLYPACVVTRSMSNKESNRHSNEYNTEANLQVTESDSDETKACSKNTRLCSQNKRLCSQNTRLCSTDVDCHSDDTNPKQQVVDTEKQLCVTTEPYNKIMTKSQLVIEQQKDPVISHLFQRAVDECEAERNPVCYYTKNSILMRKWRSLTAPANEEWSVVHQIVVPKIYQSEILHIAHEHPLSGHLGVNKTYNKILHHFFWPGLHKDVSECCRSCHTCQMVGKPNQLIPKAKLQPIPAVGEPFSRILVDCVGPLTKTKSGNLYLLTIMCVATRFPEAIPLRKINAKSIVGALIKFLTLVGLPKSIQSDQGSNFMSGIFQQVMHELGIRQYRSSAYHPESQGAIERFHQTLKNMIRAYCFENEKDWDEGIHSLVDVCRERVKPGILRF